jgi:hypothetical protein
LDEGIFRDAYLVARGMDGGFDKRLVDGQIVGNGLGAWDRLVEKSPRIASDMSRVFANWNIGEDAISAIRGTTSGDAVHSLVLNDVDAFVAGFVNRENLWGTLPGKLMNEAQPRVSIGSSLRAGVHSWAMDVAPVMIGRPLARVVQASMPSQGFTPFLDAEDSTAIAHRQFRALAERFGMSQDRVGWWASQWGAKGTREGRNEVYFRMEDEGIQTIASRLGVDPNIVKAAMPEINKYREGARRTVQRERVYIAKQALLLGAWNVAQGRAFESAGIRNLNRALNKLQREGRYGMDMLPMADLDGRANLIEVPNVDKLPSQGADPNRPVLLTQTERLIPTIDGRALEGQLKWWMRAHPTKMVRDLETRTLIPKSKAGPQYVDGKQMWEELPVTAASWTMEKVAKLHHGWEMFITASDFANMVWKASALTRPAQTPRNLADDVLRRMLVFGKAHLIASTMTGVKRAYQNNLGRTKAHPDFKNRLQLRHELIGEATARRKAERSTYAEVEGDADWAWAGNPDLPEWARRDPKLVEPARAERLTEIEAEQGRTRARTGKEPDPPPDAIFYDDMGEAWKSGLISIDDYIKGIEWMYGASYLYREVPEPLRGAIDAKARAVVHIEQGASAKSGTTPTTKIFHERELKRRVIEYHFRDQLTEWLNDLRIDAVNSRTGLPIDPKVSQIDYRTVWLRRVIDEHVRRRQGYRKSEKLDPARDTDLYRPGELLVDPFTGDIPKSFDLGDFETLHHIVLDMEAKPDVDQAATASQASVPEYRKPSTVLANYITDNVDDLLKPGHLLSMSITPDGNIRVGVSRVKSEALHKGPVKTGARYRINNFPFSEILDAGHEGVKIRLRSTNEVVYLKAAFEGEEGQAFRHRTAASSGQGTALYLTGEASLIRMLEQMGGYGVARPDHKQYATSWERAVNAQLAGDPVARMFLGGATDSDVIRWIERTPEGTKYLHRMHYFGVNYVDHVRQIEGMVNSYVPIGPEGGRPSKAGYELRERVLARTATRADLDRVRPDRSTHPRCTGPLLIS